MKIEKRKNYIVTIFMPDRSESMYVSAFSQKEAIKNVKRVIASSNHYKNVINVSQLKCRRIFLKDFSN